MTLPTSVDLRSNYEQVYNQGQDGSCGPHATTACLDIIYERVTGKAHRFDKDFLWKMAKFYNGIPLSENRGTDAPSLCTAVNTSGVYLGDKLIKGFNMVATRLSGTDTIKRLLALGYPVVYSIRMPLNLAYLSGSWKTHTLELDKSGSQDRFHFVAVVGFDDVSQHYLFENSWGSSWGDGGFFGVPYHQMFDPSFMVGVNHIDILPVLPKHVDGYNVMQAAYLTQHDQTTFTDKCAAPLWDMLRQKFEAAGPQALIDECIKWSVTDKHLETLAGWGRGTVRAFKVDNHELDWSRFIWAQI